MEKVTLESKLQGIKRIWNKGNKMWVEDLYYAILVKAYGDKSLTLNWLLAVAYNKNTYMDKEFAAIINGELTVTEILKLVEWQTSPQGSAYWVKAHYSFLTQTAKELINIKK